MAEAGTPDKFVFFDAYCLMVRQPLSVSGRPKYSLHKRGLGDPVGRADGPLRILELLTSTPGKVYAVGTIFKACESLASEDREGLIRQHFRTLRYYLADPAKRPRLIATVKFDGYKFLMPASVESGLKGLAEFQRRGFASVEIEATETEVGPSSTLGRTASQWETTSPEILPARGLSAIGFDRYSSVPTQIHFIPRPELFEPLIAELCSASPHPIGLTAVSGMGGVGKTTLAIAACHDNRVRAAFPDGIVWLPVSRNARPIERRIEFVCTLLNVRFDNYLPACIQTCLAEKAVLILLDDIWEKEDIEPFLVTSPRSRLLFTTRDDTIARSLQVDRREIGTLTQEQARFFLGYWSQCSTTLPECASEIIAECDGLPLAISMIGAALARRPNEDWQRVVRQIREAKLKYVGIPVANYQYTTLDVAVAVSVEALEARVQENYLKLAVLPDSMPATPPILKSLWAANEDDADMTAKSLVNRSLARWEGGGIVAHSIQMKYLRSQWPDAGCLDLIHGALRLARHAVETDPTQFVPQLFGRLMPYRNNSAIRDFLNRLISAAPGPWLRPMANSLHMPGTPLLRTFHGHSAAVRSVALTNDERRAVSASDREVKTWELKTGRELSSIDISESMRSQTDDPIEQMFQHDDGSVELVRTTNVRPIPLCRIILGNDGKDELVVAQVGDSFHVWNLTTKQKLWSAERVQKGIAGFAITEDGHRLLWVAEDGTLNSWDVTDGRNLRTFKGNKLASFGREVLSEGRCAVSINDEGALKVIDSECGRVLNTVEEGTLNDRSAAEEGFRSASVSFHRFGDYRRVLIAWNDDNGGRRWAFSPFPVREHRGVLGVARDRPRAVTALGPVLKLRDVETGNTLRRLASHAGPVSDVAVTNDGTHAVSTSDDGTVKLWDLDTSTYKWKRGHHSDAVTSISVSADGTKAISTSHDGTLCVWDLRKFRKIRTISGRFSFKLGRITPNGKRAITVLRDRRIVAWDLDRGERISSFGDDSEMYDLAVTLDGQSCISVYKGEVVLWNYETGEIIRRIDHCFPLSIFPLSDGRQVLLSSDKTLMVWDFTTESVPRVVLPRFSDFIEVSQNGRWAVAEVENGWTLWDLRTRRRVGHCETSEYANVAFVGDDGHRIGIIQDQTIHVWDVALRSVLASFTADAPLTRCAFVWPALIIVGDRAGRVHFLTLEGTPTPDSAR